MRAENFNAQKLASYGVPGRKPVGEFWRITNCGGSDEVVRLTQFMGFDNRGVPNGCTWECSYEDWPLRLASFRGLKLEPETV